MRGWWRKPRSRAVPPDPFQMADAVRLWRVALQLADGEPRRAREIALNLLIARRDFLRSARRA